MLKKKLYLFDTFKFKLELKEQENEALLERIEELSKTNC